VLQILIFGRLTTKDAVSFGLRHDYGTFLALLKRGPTATRC